MAMPTLLELAQSGAHFGHHRSMTYPKARPFIFGIKNSISLINLEETQKCLETAADVFAKTKADNKTILLIGTKRAIRPVVEEIATQSGLAYINDRWLGGFLTNFESIHENIKRMNELEEHLVSETSAKLSKTERLREQARLERYQRFLKGVSKMATLPDLIIIASATQDKIAVRESNQVGIPIIAITDTDINPENITYPIPANDDAPRAVELILRSIAAAPSAVVKPAKAAKAEASAEPEETAVVAKEPAKKADVEVKSEKVKVKGESKKSKVTKQEVVKKVASKKTAEKKVVKKAAGKNS